MSSTHLSENEIETNSASAAISLSEMVMLAELMTAAISDQSEVPHICVSMKTTPTPKENAVTATEPGELWTIESVLSSGAVWPLLIG